MTHKTLSYTSRFSNNALVVIDALSDGELQSARRLEEDVSMMAANAERSGYVRYFKVRTARELTDLLEELHRQCKAGMRPVLHIEAHGHKEFGLAIGGEDGEAFSWASLESALRQINKATKNNLGVVIAACWGLHAITPLKIDQPTPFYFLIGPDVPVAAGLIDSLMPRFYQALLETDSLERAMLEVDDNFKQFHCERFFYIVFGRYLKNKCMGAGGAARIEDLVTHAVEAGAVRNRESLRTIRKRAKAFLRSQELAFKSRSERFLHGRRSVSFEELKRFVANTSVD